MIPIDLPASFVRSLAEDVRVQAEGIIQRKFIRLIHGLPPAPIVTHRAPCDRCNNSGFWREQTSGTKSRIVICDCGSWYDRAEMSAGK